MLLALNSLQQNFKRFKFQLPNVFQINSFHFIFTLFYYILLLLSWDIELNPGPGDKGLSICQWNLNSVWVDDFAKISHIPAFLYVYNFDIFCICESFLDSSIEDLDPRLAIDGYEFLRCDHPSDSKRGGVCRE